jgi:hypothetical protein
MSIEAAKTELESITKEQEEDHSTKSVAEEIISNFYSESVKCTWYSSVLVNSASNKSAGVDDESDGDVIYEVNSVLHSLIYSYMRFRTPAIRVKPEHAGKVRIAWPHNLGTNVVREARFEVGNDVYQSWDSVWADCYFQFFMKDGPGKREAHHRGIGNTKIMEDWSEYLPSYPINVEQPWFYSMDPALAFPIFYKDSSTVVRHVYSFRRNISDLIRVQYLTPEGEWVNVKDHSSLSELLILPKGGKMPIPELWARYAYSRENELKRLKCEASRTFRIRNVITCDASNSSVYEKLVDLELQSKTPCLAFFWVAENKDASIVHNFSNYTTDTDDLYSGWDPIGRTSLHYGTQALFKDMASDHFNVASARMHFPSSPDEPVYHAYSYAWYSASIHGDIGIVLDKKKAKLTCAIADTNIFADARQTEKEDESDKMLKALGVKPASTPRPEQRVVKPVPVAGPEFLLRVRLLVERKFTVTAAADGKYVFSIK